jgi:hypothetical protein
VVGQLSGYEFLLVFVDDFYVVEEVSNFSLEANFAFWIVDFFQ